MTKAVSCLLGAIVILAAAAGLYSYSRSAVPKVAAFDAQPSPKVAKPESERRHLAPAGVFFLLERVAVTTPHGVTGFAPGTRVRMVSDDGESMLITANGMQAKVSPFVLTNDINMGALAARQDVQSQFALQQAMARDLALAREAEAKANADYSADQARLPRRTAILGGATKLDQGAYHERRSLITRPFIYGRYPSYSSYPWYPYY